MATWLDQQSYDSFHWKKGWIPFARFDCDYLCVNLEADAQNRGEVFTFFLKFPEQDVIATDFAAFLDKQRDYLECGVFSQSDDGTHYKTQLELSWCANWELDLLLQTGNTDAAIELLSQLVARAPQVKKELRDHVRFASLRRSERFSQLTE